MDDVACSRAIEAALEAQLHGNWRPTTAEELASVKSAVGASRGWRIDLHPGDVTCAGVDHLLVVIDAAFPRSQPRILAPQAHRNFTWPHVEPMGLLCLKETALAADDGQRVLQHINWAVELLNFSENRRRSEFEREFASYWDQRRSEKGITTAVRSLLTPYGHSREIVWFEDSRSGEIVVSDDRQRLRSWLRNAGRNPADRQLRSSWLLKLPRPWLPNEYPECGRDVLRLLPAQAHEGILQAGRRCPVLFEASTVSGPVFVATLLSGAPSVNLRKGFRSLSHVPPGRVAASFAGRPIQRVPVERVDHAWVHGRDQDPVARSLSSKRVGVVGCGSLGGFIARLLAQAGVGNLILVDADDLAAHNTARHVLGQRFLGSPKSEGLAQMLLSDFPHLQQVRAIPSRFGALRVDQLATLATCDLVISAGIDIEGDSQIDAWRQSLAQPPTHVVAWMEEFALVGHAVALRGKASLMPSFDEAGRVVYRLTDWPQQSGAMLSEAGCGNIFQPHGSVDLQWSVALAMGLALDVLSEKLAGSVRRVWKGDRSEVVRRGGTPRPQFNASSCLEEVAWA